MAVISFADKSELSTVCAELYAKAAATNPLCSALRLQQTMLINEHFSIKSRRLRLLPMTESLQRDINWMCYKQNCIEQYNCPKYVL